MANEVPWYRMYNEVLNDPKLKRVAGRTGVAHVTVLGAWAMLLTMASMSPERGRLFLAEGIPWEQRDLIDELEIPEAQALLSNFIEIGLLDVGDDGIFSIHQWSSRQYDSDSSTERVRKHREKKKSETPVKRYGHVPETPPEYRVLNIDTETVASDSAVVSDIIPNWEDGLAQELSEVVAEATSGGSYVDAYKALMETQGFCGFPPVVTQRDLKLLPLINTPAVYAWVAVTCHAPQYDQMPYLVKELGDSPNREVLAVVWEMWRGNSYPPGKIMGVIEWYHDRCKDPAWRPHGIKTKSSRASPQKRNGKPPPNEFDPSTIGQSI